MPPLPHYNFGQQTSIWLPLAELQKKYTEHFSIHHQVIHCHQQSDEILFGCFVIALNAAFDQQLSLADEGYEKQFRHY